MLWLLQRGNKGATPLSPDPAPRAHEAPVSGASSDPEAKITALGDLILQRLDDGLAQDVVFIDLKGKSAVADALIVASGRSHRHVGAIADRLIEDLERIGVPTPRVEGLPHCDWVLVDAGDVVVHVMQPSVRAYYNLEELWQVTPAQRRKAAEQAAGE